MLDKLIKFSTNYLINSNVVNEDDRDIYEYGFHSFYSVIMELTPILILAILFKQLPQTIIYYISFISMRSVAGGFHAKTHLRCFILTVIVWLLSIWAIDNIINPISYLFLSTISLVVVWLFAPIEHYNSPISENKRVKLKFKSRFISIVFFIIVFVISIILKTNTWIAASISYGMISHGIFIIPAILKNNTG